MVGPLNTDQDVRPWLLVLGGSSGIGKACVAKFAASGYDVAVIHRDLRSRDRELQPFWNGLRAEGARVLTFNKDAVDTASMRDLIRSLADALPVGSIRMLMHCISRGSLKRLVSTDGPALDRHDFEITLASMSWSLYDWTRALYEAGLFQSGARVLGLSSEGVRKVWPYYAAVANAKSSLESLIRHMAYEWGPSGLRINGLRAGITPTPSLELIPGHQQLLRNALERNPSGRLTRPEDVANAAYLLSLDEAYWINGAIIPVDGGEGLQ